MRPLAVAALTAVLATGTACGRPEPPPAPALSGAIDVTVEPVRLSLLRRVVTANGQVTPHPDFDWTIHASETAIVAELPIAEGEPVETGDLVVRFDVPSRASAIQTAEFDITQWTTKLEQANARLAELTTLFARGLTARIDVDGAKTEVATAETTLAAVRATLDGLRAAEVRDAVRARFPGVVLTRWHYQGDLVTATGNDPVLRIVDPARMQVTLDVPIIDAGSLVAGQRVTIMPLGAAPIVSVVSAVLPSASPDATTMRVVVPLPVAPATPADQAAPPDAPAAPVLPPGAPLAIGDAVLGEILIAEVAEAVVVPSRAILRASGTPYVLIAGPDGRAARRDLRLGLSTPDLTQVLDGLEPGDLVIASSLAEISEGDLVRYRQ